jgi:acetylornithine deacetylase
MGAAFNSTRFVQLLRRLVALTPRLQNSPDAGCVPEEGLAADVVLEALHPHIERGFIQVACLAGPGFEARPSLVLTVPGTRAGTVGFVGSHFDVVPADREAEGWTHDPFHLHVADDKTLYGRGVTDCLGNVAVLTELLSYLGEQPEAPRRTVVVVFIANEEAVPVAGVGLDYVLECGAMDPLRADPVFWLDSTDFGPTVGTGGVARWDLDVSGVAGHSGMPHNCVNALQLANAATRTLEEWFLRTYPAHAQEERYGFPGPSSLKPTVVQAANRSFTTIPGRVRVSGDIRLTPFYDMSEVLDGARRCIEQLDERIERGDLPPGFPRVRTADGRRGSVRLETSERYLEGLACQLDSPGLAALEQALRWVRGEGSVRRTAMTAALPWVAELARRGFDVQISGFGLAEALHAPDEHARLDDFAAGFAVLVELLERL